MKIRNEFQAGVFILVSLVFFTASIWIMGRERQIFAAQQPYHAIFKTVAGLSVGAPVRLGGISIGRVDSIGFSKDLVDNSVHVRMLINEQYLERVRQDSIAAIETQGLLGDRFISLSSGASQNQLLPNSHLQTVEPADMQSIVRKAEQVVDAVSRVTGSIDGAFTKDGKDLFNNVAAAATSFSKLMKQVETGDSLAHRIFYSPKDGKEIMEGLASSSRSLASILREIKTGDGAAHSLIYDKQGKELVENLSKASNQLAEAASVLTTLGDEVSKGSGLLHTLIYDEEPKGIKETIDNLNSASMSLKQASDALAKGDGTLGALLLDPTVYDNIVDVTDNAKRSFFLRQAIRSSLQEAKK